MDAILKLDTAPFLKALELDRSTQVSEHVVEAVLGLAELGGELCRVDGPDALGVGTGELRFTLDVTEALRDRLAAGRAGNVEGAVEGVSHESLLVEVSETSTGKTIVVDEATLRRVVEQEVVSSFAPTECAGHADTQADWISQCVLDRLRSLRTHSGGAQPPGTRLG